MKPHTINTDISNNEISRLNWFLYYISFPLLYIVFLWGAAIFLFDNDEAVRKWIELKTEYKLAWIVYYTLQFPLGDILSLITVETPFIVLAIIPNSLIVARLFLWVLKIRTKNVITRFYRINFGIAILLYALEWMFLAYLNYFR